MTHVHTDHTVHTVHTDRLGAGAWTRHPRCLSTLLRIFRIGSQAVEQGLEQTNLSPPPLKRSTVTIPIATVNLSTEWLT